APGQRCTGALIGASDARSAASARSAHPDRTDTDPGLLLHGPASVARTPAHCARRPSGSGAGPPVFAGGRHRRALAPGAARPGPDHVATEIARAAWPESSGFR